MNRKRKLYVAIAGNIGAGKTTLTRMLSQKLGWKAYYEKVIDNPYLEDFYKDMKRWSFHLQIFFLSHRFKTQQEITEWPGSCIQDRSIYEDAEIFAATLHKQGFMSDRDFDNYKALFEIMTSYLRKPDLIIYLQASTERLFQHIKKRGRAYEQQIVRDYLEQLNQAYEEWIERARTEGMNVFTFNMEHRDFEHNERDFNILYKSIRDLENQTWIEGVY
ncbi:deoxynucleoside kinase [Caldithrix abyssi DSM 13497]|uniref:Deoxyadenosine/deoxycytidine kinase n=1 Tax=Caldithrix abyssi DSM 13497 TaxID=880073 RepID=H1XW00_CALAY|nr:deoxynucleoside kinase [Caldithrix abyssi]APF17688.1 Deoxyadenosine/deoxycytidine kinase [Caldithrix abyssi DSM 13497]EHO41772.1 deoxynucleoside kinase [Caldithrix abyssi DSM 13497]